MAYDTTTSTARNVSSRQDIKYARWSSALKMFVVISFDQSQSVLEAWDQQFQKKREIGKYGSLVAPVLSPDGAHLAYQNGDHYTSIDLMSAQETQLGTLAGNMGPAWVDDNTVMVGTSEGTFYLAGLDGKIKTSYTIPDLRKHSRKN